MQPIRRIVPLTVLSFTVAVTLIPTLVGCSDDPFEELAAGEYVVFGDFYGECLGPGCVDIFKIQSGKVYEDTLDRYPSTVDLPYPAEFVEIERGDFEELNEILSSVPDELFDEVEVVIGQPDAGDWGGYYFEVQIDGVTYFWLIDKMQDNLPAYLREFADALEEAISLVEGDDL